ncbi:MAG TPA: glycosyltransferase [Flavobacteriales bacterium]|jgi:glycosyltransferase involved in cell wall biosynthesis|nr:glycosyltransferase [Flavobacteriales bacterium]HQV37343.1 glycosyltransferase [Flavobacteriales bacterium]HQY02994.1 glycosyltransferase [Flavobacteriales bacterium]
MSQYGPILLICHGFPPVRGIGGRRWAKFAKELARRGYTVHVIRSAGSKGRMDSLWSEDTRHEGIVHHPLPHAYPAVMTKRPLTSVVEKVMYRVWSNLLPFLVRGNIYDPGVFWRRRLLAESRRLIRGHDIRTVIVTGAPFSLMAFAAELKTPFPELHLVADFRDPWTWGTDYGFGTLAPERMRHEQDREAMVARTFDKLIASTSSITEHLRSTYGGAPEQYATIPHAVDPDDLHVAPSPVDDGMFKMIYAGSLYSSMEAERYLQALMEAFKALREKHPAVFAKCRFDLFITGDGTRPYEQLAKDHGLEKQIHFHSPLPPKEILERIAGSDLVLAFLPGNKKDIMVTKFNEIFHLRRPILHIGEPGVVSRTIVGRKLGDSLRVEELVTELPRIISGERTIEIDRNADHSEHLLATITDKLISEVLA